MKKMFENINYKELNPLQVGRIGEYWVKIILTLKGCDVYTTEVDDKGIDFVVRINELKFIDIQVKTVRENTKYVYINKDNKSWKILRDNLYLALVILNENSFPSIFLIKSTEWENPNDLIKDNKYSLKGLKSKDDWGLNLSNKNLIMLDKYDLSNMIKEIII